MLFHLKRTGFLLQILLYCRTGDKLSNGKVSMPDADGNTTSPCMLCLVRLASQFLCCLLPPPFLFLY